MRVKVYGASDDLIEVCGDLREEFGAYGADGDDPRYVAFSDGTVLRVTYDGFWRFVRIAEGTAAFEKHEGADEDDDYSDIVTLTGDNLRWVVCGRYFVKGRAQAAA